MANLVEEVQTQYWDTCLFVHFLTKADPDKATIVNEGFQLARSGKLLIIISAFVIAETRPHDGSKYKHPNEDDRKEIEQLFTTNRRYLRVVAASRPIALRSREIAAELARRGHNITVPDAIHLATAEQEKVGCFLTWDGENPKDARRSQKLLPCNGLLGNPPMAIKMPQHDWGPLFLPAAEEPLALPAPPTATLQP